MSINRRMGKEDVVRIYNEILLSHKKRTEIVPFAELWMDLKTSVKNEVSQKEKNKYCILFYAYMWNLEKWYR